MGWLIRTKYHGEKVNLSNYCREVCRGEGLEVMGVSVVNSIGYVAVKVIKTGEVSCCILMLRNTKTEYGYKDLHEEMGVYHWDCPLKILNMLTETKNEYALKWREECRARAIINKRYRKVNDGVVIKIGESISFGRNSQWGPYDTFKCIDRRKSHYEASDGTIVKLRKRHIVKNDFEIIM